MKKPSRSQYEEWSTVNRDITLYTYMHRCTLPCMLYLPIMQQRKYGHIFDSNLLALCLNGDS